MKRIEDIKNSALILLIILAAHFQLVFKIFYTKWDNLSAFFPYRYTANHFWRSGHLPLWDPYQNLGYPMHANPQGYVWYPITQFFSIFGEYSPYFMSIESVLHIVIAALGVYFLFKYLDLEAMPSIIGGICFGLSGFVTGSSQIIGFTIAAAWLPWIFLYFLKCLKQTETKYFIQLSVLGMLQITGSYVAFSIILVYVLLGTLIYKLIRKQVILPARTLLYFGIISLPVFLVLSSPFLYSIYDSLQYFSRATPLSYDLKNFTGNFSFECFQSLMFPYIISSSDGFKNVDVSLSNIYIGILTLGGAIAYLFTKGIYKHKIAIVLSLCIFLVLGLGTYTPAHKLVFTFIPGINLFRHPYLFQLYSTLLLIYMGCTYLDYDLKSTYSINKKQVLITILVLMGLVIYSLTKSNLNEYKLYLDAWSHLSEKSPLNKYSHVAIQGIILIALYVLIYKFRMKKSLVITLFIVEMIVAVQLNSPLNMYYNVSTSHIDDHLDQITNQKLTNQNVHEPLNNLVNSQIPRTTGLWVNLNTFTRTTGINGYNPFIYTSLASLAPEVIRDSIGAYGLVRNESNVSNLKIGYNNLSFDINTQTKFICISQNYHHNWKCSIEGKPIHIMPDKYGLLKLETEKQIGKAKLMYGNPLLSFFSLSSVSLFVILLLSMLTNSVSNTKVVF